MRHVGTLRRDTVRKLSISALNEPLWATVKLSSSSARTAERVDECGGLAGIVNLRRIEPHPRPVCSGDLEHPDEARGDLDVEVKRFAVELSPVAPGPKDYSTSEITPAAAHLADASGIP
jgi:DNA primase